MSARTNLVRVPQFQKRPRVDELTEREAATLEAVGRGENPCARVGEENTAIVGTRRRAVSDLCNKGFLTRGLVFLSRKGEPRNFPEDVKATAPELTAKGREFIAGRADTEPPADQSCACGHVLDEHGGDPNYRAATGCNINGCDCIAFDGGAT